MNPVVRGTALIVLLGLLSPGYGQEPEYLDLTRMKQSVANFVVIDAGWYPCDAVLYEAAGWQKAQCASVTTRHGLNVFGQQIRSRQDGDRRVLLDLIKQLDARIDELEARLVAADQQR